MRAKKTSSKPIKRCGLFNRDQAKQDGKSAMDALWLIANAAKADLSVTEYEAASFEESLRIVEQELNSLMLPPGTKASLPDDIG